MHSPRQLAQRRILYAMAWFVFLFCSSVIATGMVVGRTSPSVAQEIAQPDSGDGDGTDDTGELADAQLEEAVASPPPAEAEQVEEALDEAPAEQAAADSEAAEEAAPDNAAADAVDEQAAQPETFELSRMKGEESSFFEKFISFFGIFALLGVAWLMSTNRRKVDWKLVGIGTGLQLLFALFIFYVPGGQKVFEVATVAVSKLLEFTNTGADFIFSSYVTGSVEGGLINFAFAVLPTIIFFSALMTVLYHLGIMQKLVHMFAWVMQRTMGISGAESMSAAANIFVGQTEAPLVVKPFVKNMTLSELMVVMTGGFATVAGGVLAIYVGMMEPSFPDIAGHLLAASVMSAPAALVIAKIIYPETDRPVTAGKLEMEDLREDVNVLDAASRGAAEGMKLALNVAAMLLAFIALIELVNYLITWPSMMINKSTLGSLAEAFAAGGMALPEGCDPATVADAAVVGCVETMQAAPGMAASWIAPVITMQDIFGYIFWPFAWVMGVPFEDCYTIARLLGEKMVINELVAYGSLQQLLLDPNVVLSERSIIIATYALCGFANFGSIGIQLGGIGGIAPERKGDLARIALRAMFGGTLAAFMTATIAGILI
ncbi:NupC/NupG family nucleoside CNT transporter [Lujinxingia vulgaris]|uniref:NupC/NupG family nucleoside CNT transporter n=1 Tax=Lujinxingia vulgaris TaxID=2600176 RepID=A0A5C6XER7_9DELT|nr:nucleoside transporter C-terminal domain-containing protein [Lujinxingia vulgaris]TXD35918.1 NupC/NupG family nucleoside CNT transporter [Lujinxingia vulgaris]